jgi:hypothetical protein
MFVRHPLMLVLRSARLGLRLTIVAMLLAIVVQSVPHKAFADAPSASIAAHGIHHAQTSLPDQSKAHHHHKTNFADPADDETTDCSGSICCAGCEVSTGAALGVNPVIFATRAYPTHPVALSHEGATLERPPRIQS